MAKIGAAALTFIGYAFGGPVGALIGGILGQILFPAPGIKGPRLDELRVQTSTVGAPVQIRYGTTKGAGNIIWSGGLIETKHEDEQGGFLGFGGQKVTNYTYSVDFAIGICDGEDGSPAQPAGIRRLWAGPDLIYDASDDATLTERLNLLEIVTNILEIITGIRAMSAQLNFTFYDGSDDQLPDPTIEAYEVAGTVPAYRGLAYVVFNDFQLAKYGNQIPPIIIETYSGAPTECGIYSPGQLFPWDFEQYAGYDPRRELNSHLYGYFENGGSTHVSFESAVNEMETALARPMLISHTAGLADSIYVHGWGIGTAPNDLRPCDAALPIADYVAISLSLNSLEIVDRYCLADLGLGSIGCTNALGFQVVSHVTDGQRSGFYVRLLSGDVAEDYLVYSPDQIYASCTSPAGSLVGITDHQLSVTRSILPANPCTILGAVAIGNTGYCVSDGVITQGVTWTEVSGTFHVLQEYTTDGANLVTKYPVGPALRNDDPNYSNQAYWEAAYAAALADGEPIAPGLVFGVDYPATQNFAYFIECDTVDAECVPMALIASDLCRRSGLRTDTATQIDVTGLTTCVPGYVIGRAMSSRDAMGPLRLFGLWDAVESGDVLRFVERGSAIVATISEDDLGAHENGSEAPPSVEVSRVQEKELPRRLRLHYPNFLHDHEPSEQAASRLTTEAVEELDVEVAVSMEPDTAAQLAEIHLYDAWISRNRFTFVLNNDWLHLEPTDCIEIPVEGETRRVRLVAVNYKIGGLLECEAVADDDGSYQSTAVATPEEPSGGPIVGPGAGPICGSVAVLLDIPRLREADIDAGYYVAIYGLCPETWTCAELYRSSDGGLTYGRIARTNDQTVVGEIETITGPATDPTLPGESPAYDTSTSITVTLFQGELASVTDAQIAAGQNMAAIGVDGRWVIIQFKTATFDTGDTWVLTDLIWGVNETQHLLYTTVAGDTFVLLSDPALIRVPEEAAAIGVSKSFKTVTCGEPIDSVTAFDFTTWGLSYRRTCPSTVISATLTAPPSAASDGDAYLLPNDTALSDVWADHGGAVAHWSDETDSWVYCTPVPGTIVTIGVDSSSDPGDDSVISDGDGNYNPAPWTPAIPPLFEIDTSGDLDTSYFVVHTGTGYRKVLGADVGGTGSGVTDHGALTGLGDDDHTQYVLRSILTTNGDLFTRAAGVIDRIGIGSANQFLRVVGGVPAWANGGSSGGGPALAFVGQVAVAGAAATVLTISGLDLTTDECYFIQVIGDNPTGSASGISVYYNADTTATNYDTETSIFNATVHASARTNNAQVVGPAAANNFRIEGYIRSDFDTRKVGFFRCNGQAAGGPDTLIDTFLATHRWQTTATNVTGITISGSIANSLAIGTRLMVWKLTT